MKREELFKKFNNYKFNKDEKVLLITHNDLDGSGPAVVLKKVFDDLTIQHVSNKGMDGAIRNSLDRLLEGQTNYDHVFVCDISCTEETAKIILESGLDDKYIILDHHPTADYLNDYPFALAALGQNPEDSFSHKFFEPYGALGKPSGSSLTLDFVYYANLLSDDEYLNKLIFYIQCFDTWDWKTVCGGLELPMKLNQLFRIIGIRLFDENYCKDRDEIIDNFGRQLLEIDDTKANDYIQRTLKRTKLIIVDDGNRTYSCAFVFAAEYLTPLFEKMEEEYPDVDLYVVDTGTSFSLRCRKDDINVGELMKRYGGGGHPQAAGISYDDDIRIDAFKSIFS